MEEMIEARIGRYLSGEMTDIEKAAFVEDLASNPSLNEQFLAFQRIWNSIPPMQEENWDVAAAFERFSQGKMPEQKSSPTLKSYRFYWAAAALVLLSLGVYTVFFRDIPPVSYTYQEGKIEPIVLADGSKIYLNKGADVTVYPFTRKKRSVALVGEAFFEISPDTKRPFMITSGGTLTEVVGTEFTIQEDNGHTSIFVSSGKVIFSSVSDGRVAVALTEGEAAVYEDNKMSRIPNPSPNINSWLTQQLRFGKKMSFTDVIADVSAYFDREIIIENEAIKSCSISISLPFKNPEISSVLEAVAGAVNAKLVQEGGKFIIRGGGC